MIVGILNGVRRIGRWQARPAETVIAVFGGVNIDYTEAILPPGSITLRTFALFSGITVRVPAGSAITPEGVTIFGGEHVKRRQDRVVDSREARSFFVGGLTLFSGVQVEEV
jgi:hypothetical protein